MANTPVAKQTPAVPASSASPRTLAKIIATVGPASASPDIIAQLILAGVHIFRLNFSHGTLADHAERLRTIREVAAELVQPVAVLGDLQGPKIRVGVIAESAGVRVHPGDVIAFQTQPNDSIDPAHPAILLPSGYDRLALDVRPGERVLINDGAIRTRAVERAPRDAPGVLRCAVESCGSGLITSKKGINLPDTQVQSPAITSRDWECVEWAVAHGLDYLALSFVRRAEDVIELKTALAGMCPMDFNVDHTGIGSFIPVIAKIEKPEGVTNIDAILEHADGIMVARGDLGVEMDLAEVPLIQKRLIAKADEWGKPCIVATQMLETMTQSAIPTRAEASDVANAVLDGADAVMLSAETATGVDPVNVVQTMRRIVAHSEQHLIATTPAATPARRLLASGYRTAALAHGAFYVARDTRAKLIICWSQEGGTARYLSQTGTLIPIIAYTCDPRQVRRMALLRGVTPRLMPVPGSGSLAEWNRAVDDEIRMLAWASDGDPVVLVAGRPLGVRKSTTALAVHAVGSPDSGFMRDGSCA